jgi:hypothetical protein
LPTPRLPLAAALLCASLAVAKPPGPSVFCSKYPTSPLCVGQLPACTTCHVAAPQLNGYGTAVQQWLAPGAPRPLSDGDFSTALPAALAAVESQDSDGDGVSNLVEIQKGTLPGDPKSFPNDVPCAGGYNPQYGVCHYDARYVYKRLELDFCGASPTYAQVQAFAALDDAARLGLLDAELDRCVQTEFWRGKNGQLWRLAHPKIRPVHSLKSGEDQGAIPLADYYDDYALYAWSQTDDHDARSVITADYYVQRLTNPTRYQQAASLPNTQAVDQAHRAGNFTTSWTLVYFVMFTPLPRSAAAQMYRAYLGYDISRQEGLYSVPNEPHDYDAKGVQAQACAACHATLDPLSYPYRNYNGLTSPYASYEANRLENHFASVAPNMTQIPEAGAIFGQPVASLTQLAQVGANSDAFAMATVKDYWKFLVGHAPTAEEQAEFVAVWQRFKGQDNYRVQTMLHSLIRTEAYGAP